MTDAAQYVERKQADPFSLNRSNRPQKRGLLRTERVLKAHGGPFTVYWFRDGSRAQQFPSGEVQEL